VHVPGHPAEARRLLLDALPGNDSVYLRLLKASSAEPREGPNFQVVRSGGPLRSLGVRRDAEVRVYGTMTDHDRAHGAHGLDEAGIARSVTAFLP
jgi:hypothetical protein